MTEHFEPRRGGTTEQALARRGIGVVPKLRRTYDDCVETELPVRLQRLLELLDEAEQAKS